MKTCLSPLAICRILLVLTTTLAVTQVTAAGLNARLDRMKVFVDESVFLTLTYRGDRQVSGSPDLAPLSGNFEVLDQSVRTSIGIAQGQRNVVQEWIIKILPKQVGTFTIPPIFLNSLSSEPIQIEVVEFKGTGAIVDEDVFIEIDFEPDRPYVQEQTIFTIRLYLRVPVFDGNLSNPDAADAVIERMGSDKRFTVWRNGNNYRVVERQFMLFFETSSPTSIPPIEFDGVVSVIDSNGESRRLRKRVESEPVNFQVLPQPREFTGAFWLPAKDILLVDSWQEQLPDLEPGVPVRRHIKIDAVGLREEQLPGLEYEQNAATRIYGSQPKLSTELFQGNLHAVRDEEFVVIPQVENGKIIVPEFHLVWWDTDEDREKVALLPSIQVSMLTSNQKSDSPELSTTGPSPDTAESPVDVLTREVDKFWRYLSIALAGLWIITVATLLVMFLRQRSSLPKYEIEDIKQQKERIAVRAIRNACDLDNTVAAQDALLQWAKLRWPEHAPNNLIALGQISNSAAFLEALAELDRAIYSGAAHSWRGDALWKEFSKIRKPWIRIKDRPRFWSKFSRPRQRLEELWPSESA